MCAQSPGQIIPGWGFGFSPQGGRLGHLSITTAVDAAPAPNLHEDLRFLDF
jgi:hypothetical protein